MESEISTKIRRHEAQRRYDDACGTAHGLELVGDRWALLVVRELVFGPRRFTDLRRDLRGISATVLSQRLSELAKAGILSQQRLPPPAPATVYALTPWGLELERVVIALGRWAARSPGHDPSLPLSSASIMLSFRTMFRPERAHGLRLAIGFTLGEERYAAHVGLGALSVARSETAGTDAAITALPEAIAAWVYGGEPLERLEAAGRVRIAGDRAAALAFAGLFSLPPRIG